MKKTLLTSMLALGLATANSQAQVTYTWTGAVDGNWNNSANWDGSGVPVDAAPTHAGLGFSSVHDKIVFKGSTAPTMNVPGMGGSPNENTPQLDFQGTGTWSLDTGVGPTYGGGGFFGGTVDAVTVGDGNGLAGELTVNLNHRGDLIRESRGFRANYVVNADGVLNFVNTNATVFSIYDSRYTRFVVNGGRVHFAGSLDYFAGDAANEYADLTVAGSSFTAAFGDDFADIHAVHSALVDETFRCSPANLIPVAVDNNDGTFTVTAEVDTGPTLNITVMNDLAAEHLTGPGTIRIMRGAAHTSGDLVVFYTLSGTAESNDYTESHTGVTTITDGNYWVDLDFSAINDGIDEGVETIELELTADDAYTLGAVTTGSIVINEPTFITANMALTIEPDGKMSLSRNGVLVSTTDSLGWSIYNFIDGTRVALDDVVRTGTNEFLLASVDGKYQVNVKITANDRYFKFELIRASNTHGGELDDDWPGHRVEFDLKTNTQGDGWMLNTLLLNPMSELTGPLANSIRKGINFLWPYPHLAQTTDQPQPQGMIAVFGFVGDAEHDDILADIWVAEESLPRPNRDNLTSWTRADVDAWLDRGEGYFSTRLRHMSLSPRGNPANLYTAADIAYEGGLNQIGLHNADWQGNSQGDPNAALFPNGVSDVIAWREYCEARGIDIHLHGFGACVQADDPYYGKNNMHDGLARSARGTLVNSVAAGETTLIVQPDLDLYLGMKEGMLPFIQPTPWDGGYGKHFPPYYDTNTSRVKMGSQLLGYTATLTVDNLWQIELNAQSQSAYNAGDSVEFMVMGKSGWFMPDPRTAFFEQLADEYSTILNHFQGNAVYDGEGWHRHLGHWGTRRFTQMVFEGLDHPSQGSRHFGNFDQYFKRIQNTGGSSGNVPMRTWGPSALATSFDDVSHGIDDFAGGKDIIIRGDHSGIDVSNIANYGAWNYATAAMQQWSELNPLLTSEQVDLIRGANEDFFVATETAAQYQVTRTRAMRRPDIDCTWRRMTERPDIAPRQYFKADGVALMGLENPYVEQTPVVELHVMAGMSESSVQNTSLMPTDAGMIINPVGAQQALGYESGKLIVSLDNSQSSANYYHWDRDTPPDVGYWTYESLSGTEDLDMSESRGIAITVNVPEGQNVDGGALVFSLNGGFPRTYIVELDFVGQRTIEIPHGVAINNTAIWYQLNGNPTGVISAGGYGEVDLFRLYIAGLPAGESTSVEVLDIVAMKEDHTQGLIDPVLTHNGESVTVNGTIPYNHYLIYPGGASAEVYGPNWNFVQNLTVSGSGLTAVNGTNTFSVNAALSPNAHLSSRIKVQDLENVIFVDGLSNTTPSISGIPDQTIDENTSVTVAFEVSDAETPAESLIVTASSSAALVPQSGLVFGGSGTNRTLTVTPAAGHSGSATITVRVSDGSRNAREPFNLTVNAIVPDIDVTPTVIHLTETVGNVATQNLVISNSGPGLLNWFATFSVGGDGYTVQEVPYNWIDISASGTSVSLWDDATAGPYNLGFSTEFYGQSFDKVRVCSNGFLSFTDTATTYLNRSIPSSSAPDNLLALFWDDLNPSAGGTIYYQQLDENTFVVQYQEVPRYGSSDLITAQVLIKANGTILYQYKRVDHASSCTVGIQNADGTEGVSYAYNQAGKIDANLALQFNAPAPSWTGLSSQSGTVAPGSSETITLSLDASAVGVGTHPLGVTITSDDPDESSVDVSGTFVVEPNGGSDPPDAEDQLVTTPEDTAVLVSVVATDPDENTLSYAIGLQPANGTLSGQLPDVIYTPNADWNGTDSFTFVASDDALADTGLVTIVVSPVDDVPAISGIADRVIEEDASATVTFAVTDAETASESLLVSVVSSDSALVPGAGLVLGGSGANRTLTVTPVAGQSGTATITVTVSDGSLEADETFDLTVVPQGAYYSMQVSFTNFAGRGVLTNFPALVKLTLANTDNYAGFLGTDGYELRFWNDSGLTEELNYEIERFDAAGDSTIWVQVPELTQNSSIWVSWGNPAYTDQPDYTTNGVVWDSNYDGVWHLDGMTESTSGKYHGTDAGTASIAGQIGDGRDFVRAEQDSISLPVEAFSGIDATDEVTLSVWTYGDPAVLPQNTTLFRGQADGSRELSAHVPWGGTVYWDAFGNYDRINKSAATGEYGGQWNHWVFVKDSGEGTQSIYLNGALWHSGVGTKTYTQVTSFFLGGSSATTENWDGTMDEFRVSNIARSPDWIWASWMSQGANHDSFAAYGPVTPVTSLSMTANGTPHSWHDSHGLVDSGDYEAADLLDSDGDGRLNWVEFRDGTDPVDANSLLQITDLSINGNQLSLTWQAVAGKTYTMWFTPDLVNQPWIRKKTGLIGADPTSSVSVQIDGDRGFYSIETER